MRIVLFQGGLMGWTIVVMGFSICLLRGRTQAIAPPRVPIEPFLPPLNLSYIPKSIHPELCRSKTEAECREEDEAFMEHGKNHRKVGRMDYEQRQAERRRRLEQAQDSGGDLSSDMSDEDLWDLLPDEFEDTEAYWDAFFDDNFLREQYHRHLTNPSLGNFTVLTLLMRFNDHRSRRMPEKFELQVLLNLRMRKYFRDNSYDQYVPWFEVYDWITVPESESYYADGNRGLSSRFREAWHYVLDQVDASPGWDWTRFDLDGDRKLDNLVILHSGYPAETGVDDCYGAGLMDRIWSHATVGSTRWTSADGSMKSQGYMTASAIFGTCGSEPARMAILMHEYMHTFNVPDLYDFQFVGNGVGAHDIMAYPYGIFNDEDFPTMLSAWCKIEAEWQSPIIVDSSRTLTIRPSALYNEAYKIPIKTTPNLEEYFILENRQQISFDIFYYGPGVSIFHIDEGTQQDNAGYPGQAGWPENGNHYKEAVVQKDGEYDLELDNNQGDYGDLFVEGDVLPPGDGFTYPNTDARQFGIIESTGITITVLSMKSNGNFIVEVDFGVRRAPAKDHPPVVPRTRNPILVNETKSPMDIWLEGHEENQEILEADVVDDDDDDGSFAKPPVQVDITQSTSSSSSCFYCKGSYLKLIAGMASMTIPVLLLCATI